MRPGKQTGFISDIYDGTILGCRTKMNPDDDINIADVAQPRRFGIGLV